MNTNETFESPAEFFEVLQKSNTKIESLRDELKSDPGRFEQFSRSVEGIMVDFSRTSISSGALKALLGFVEKSGIAEMRDRMYRGERINFTENRAVLHPVWRERNFAELLPEDEARELQSATEQLAVIADALHQGRLPGQSEKGRIRHLVHIGIGGSLLGPKLLCEAFPPGGDCPQIHFLSSVDALERERLLETIEPEETAIMLVSKSFTTSEVLLHARRLREWQASSLSRQKADERLFAVTSAKVKARDFGVPAEHILQMGEWTGGRFSVWSPVGVTAAVTMGSAAFDEFLDGGASMDRHFRDAPLAENLPVLLALISTWHRNVCGYDVHGLVPYDGRLQGLPGWLQQVEMESNGKSVDRGGEATVLQTSPVVMGDTGTDAQHALFQAFHQGTTVVPLDFIGVIRPDHDDREAQQVLLSHMLAQATALAVGRNFEEVSSEMRRRGMSSEDIETIAPHRVMPGNRPSTVFLLDELTPAILGRLLALYELKVFVESVIWQINAFDQWGVELGKVLAGSIQPVLSGEADRLPDEIPGLEGLTKHIRTRSV